MIINIILIIVSIINIVLNFEEKKDNNTYVAYGSLLIINTLLLFKVKSTILNIILLIFIIVFLITIIKALINRRKK
ncbi:Uncharacterised protein [[Clostridium] sordellii]|uniref:hypothetical protein n=1 Tax=Paraclostridium sordellii TaxID=1505 RepID=UPI0005E56016|nr:hypothetical protein [Paeniclostridium sordellii]CEN29791.1 Uncharacterised protein [[Clostridium] sordellii] [Paeniclostridium sordellii]CEN30347.1 Uncharacterised protein [[Clostridium] sordellii] [Paeniclostridium sordellii]